MATHGLAGAAVPSARRGLRWRPLACALLLGALVGCCGDGDDDDGGLAELLFVGDETRVSTFSVSGGALTALDTESVPGLPGTYARSGTLVTVSMHKHNVPGGDWVRLDFLPGAGGTATDGDYVATVVDGDTFTVVDGASGTITGGTVLRSPTVSLAGTYFQAGTTVTVTIPGHGLNVGDTVTLDYTSGASADDNVEIGTVPDANTFTVVADAPISTAGTVTVVVGTNYTVFGIAMHPNGRWLYVTTSYDCYEGNPYCWGGDLISRFSIDWGSGDLTFEESFRSTAPGDPDTSAPEPVTLVFSADGTRLFHQDDDLDGLRMWDVDPSDGALTLLASSAPNTTGQHGIAVSGDASRVYHGSRVFTVGTLPDSLTLIPGGSSGEANQILGGTLFALMGSANSSQVRAFTLADPDLPVLLAS
jgi:hypothetical protein